MTSTFLIGKTGNSDNNYSIQWTTYVSKAVWASVSTIQMLALIFINTMNAVCPQGRSWWAFNAMSHQMKVKFNKEGERMDMQPLWVLAVPCSLPPPVQLLLAVACVITFREVKLPDQGHTVNES